MTKVVIVGDTHFGNRGDSIFFAQYQERYFNQWFFPLIEKENVTHFLQVGDLVDRRKFINFKTLNNMRKQLLQRLNDLQIESMFVVGNHDAYYRDTLEINAQNLLLQQYNNVVIIDNPINSNIDQINFLFIPWICSQNEQQVRKLFETTNASYVVGHFEIVGFQMYRGNVCEEGLSAKLFEQFHDVWSGHFHHRSRQDNILYVGGPYELTWQDYGEERGVHIFDTESKQLTFHPCPLKLYNKVYYDDANITKDQMDLFDPQLIEGTYIKLIIKNKQNPVLFDKFVDKFDKFQFAEFQIIDDQQIVDDSEVSLDQSEDTLTMLNKYVEDVKIDKIDLVKTELHEIYYEALNVEG